MTAVLIAVIVTALGGRHEAEVVTVQFADSEACVIALERLVARAENPVRRGNVTPTHAIDGVCVELY